MAAESRALPGRIAVAVTLLALLGLPATVSASYLGDIGKPLRTIAPTAATTVDNVLIDPTCDSQGGTSVALVQGSKLAGVDPVRYPVLLATSCLDNGGGSTAIARRARVNFLDPGLDPITGLPSGKVIKSIQTTIAGVVSTPSNGWAHWYHRPDFADLLACANDGSIYTIDFDRFNSTADGTARAVPRPPGLPSNCVALGWDAEEDIIYQGISGSTGTVGVYRILLKPDRTTIFLGAFNTPCTPSGIAVTGGVLVVACDGVSTILRLDKNTGQALGTLGALGLPAGASLNPDLGDLACDPVTFHKDPATGRDRFVDAMWSRNGSNGNGVVALQFPAFTCGLPSNATVLAAGLSGPLAATCFDAAGKVVDSDGDGLPDCWETHGIDFDGDGVVDLQLCVAVDTNGDGVPDATECADPNHKDLFAEIDFMDGRKPDPQALSQTQPVATAGVKSVREAFAAAPVANPDGTPGIRIHFQVDEQVQFTTLANTQASHVTELVFTPCTPPGINPDGTLNAKSLFDAAEFDTIKKANFGTVTERANANALNAKRLVFRYVLFADRQVGSNQGGASNSGCAEIGGDDATVTLGTFVNTTDQQAGTLMHEFGHTLGLRHGGEDNVNCKPNYRSVMSYSRQFAGSPIPGRRLDFSRSADPVLADITKTGQLNEASLSEFLGLGLGVDLSGNNTLGPIPPFFPSADQIAFGPTAWSVVAATAPSINWNKNKTKQGAAIIDPSPVTGNLNQGSGGCDGSGTLLNGQDDWSNLLYRFSAAVDFAGGVHTESAQELTKEQEGELFLAADLDANGVPDAQDCGTAAATTTAVVGSNSNNVRIGVDPTTRGFSPSGIGLLIGSNSIDDFNYTGTDATGFTGVTGISATWPSATPVWGQVLCTHRIDIKPSFPLPKALKLGTEANVTIAIFSEATGTHVWNAAQVQTDTTLTFSMESFVTPVKANAKSQGTCSLKDGGDPVTGVKDGIKDVFCQFPTSGLPLGKHLGVVSGFFLDPATSQLRAFRARQEVTILP